jgi:hypothetical protein
MATFAVASARHPAFLVTIGQLGSRLISYLYPTWWTVSEQEFKRLRASELVPQLFRMFPVASRGVLSATIRVINAASRRAASLDSGVESGVACGPWQSRSENRAHSLAISASRLGIQKVRQRMIVWWPSCRRQIHYPFLIRSRGSHPGPQMRVPAGSSILWPGSVLARVPRIRGAGNGLRIRYTRLLLMRRLVRRSA